MILEREELVTKEVIEFANWAYINGIDFSYMGKQPGNEWINSVLDRFYKEKSLGLAITELEDKFDVKLEVSKENDTKLDKIARILELDLNEIKHAKGNDIDIYIKSDGNVDSYFIDGKKYKRTI